MDVNASNVALLVKIGWLPLNYILAIQALSWLYRIATEKSVGIYHLFYNMKDIPDNDEIWGDSIFFKPAYDMIKRLEPVYFKKHRKKVMFLESKNIQKFKSYIVEACFIEVNAFWKSYHQGRFTYSILPKWENQKILPKPHSRNSEKMYYRMCFTQNNLKEFLFSLKNTKEKDNLCRFCCSNVENVNHILIGCCKLNYVKMKNTCKRLDIKYNIKNLLTHYKLKNCVEAFLQKNFLFKN